jgi:RNA methyltransferase, TrmH family
MKKLYANQAKLIKSLSSGKGRGSSGLFVAEGIKAVTELLLSDIGAELIVCDPGFDPDVIQRKCPDKKLPEMFEHKIETISSMKNSEGVLAVGKLPEHISAEEFFKRRSKILALFGISDPGNLGTLVRSALWFGIDGIVLFGSCADFFSPKVIRSSMGAVFHIDHLKLSGFQDCAGSCGDYLKIGTFLDKKSDFKFEQDEKMMLFLGNEANGLDEELKKVCHLNFRIGSAGSFDSLNVSVAGGIIMHEIFKIRGK